MTTTFPAPPSKSLSHNAPGNPLSLLLHHFASLFSHVDDTCPANRVVNKAVSSFLFKSDLWKQKPKMNQGGKMVKVADVVVRPEAGAVNKLDEKK